MKIVRKERGQVLTDYQGPWIMYDMHEPIMECDITLRHWRLFLRGYRDGGHAAYLERYRGQTGYYLKCGPGTFDIVPVIAGPFPTRLAAVAAWVLLK